MIAKTNAIAPEAQNLSAEIAGFWRRIAAIALDWLILGGVGMCIGLLWFDALAALGSMGRLVGGAVAWGYFAILDSRVAGGQTIGKRVLSIRVVCERGGAIGVARSSIRALVFLLPITLNGMNFGSSQLHYIVSTVCMICVFGLGGALVYFYIFNRRTRQSLHDLAARTFVVNAGAGGVVRARIWRPHLAVAAVWVLAVAIFFGPALVHFAGQIEIFRAMEGIHRVAQSAVPRTLLTVQMGSSNSTALMRGASSAEYLSVQAFPRHEPSSYQEVADRIAATLLAECPEARAVDRLIIRVTFGYDVMVWKMSIWKRFSASPEEWGERLDLGSPDTSAV